MCDGIEFFFFFWRTRIAVVQVSDHRRVKNGSLLLFEFNECYLMNYISIKRVLLNLCSNVFQEDKSSVSTSHSVLLLSSSLVCLSHVTGGS